MPVLMTSRFRYRLWFVCRSFALLCCCALLVCSFICCSPLSFVRLAACSSDSDTLTDSDGSAGAGRMVGCRVLRVERLAGFNSAPF